MSESSFMYLLNISTVITIFKLGVSFVKGKPRKVILKFLAILLVLEHLKLVHLYFYENMKSLCKGLKTGEIPLFDLLFSEIDIAS